MTHLLVDGVLPRALDAEGKLIPSEIDRRIGVLRQVFPTELWMQAGTIFAGLEFDVEGMEAFLAALVPEGDSISIPDLATFAALVAALAPDALLTLMEAWPEPVSDLLRGIAACGDLRLPHDDYLTASLNAIPDTPAPPLGSPHRTRSREEVLSQVREQRTQIAALQEEVRALYRAQSAAATPSRGVDRRIAQLRQELLAPIRALEAKEKVDTTHTGAYTTRMNAIEQVIGSDGTLAQAISAMQAVIDRQEVAIRSLQAELTKRPIQPRATAPVQHQHARALTFDVSSEDDDGFAPHDDGFFKQGSRSLTVWRDAGVGIDRVTTLAFRTYYDGKIVNRLRNAVMKRKAYEVLENILMLCHTPGSEKFESRVLEEYTYLALSAFEGSEIATVVSKARKDAEWDPALRAVITDARKKEKERTKPLRDRSRSKARKRSTSGNSNHSERGGPGNGRGRTAGRGRGRGAARRGRA